MQRCPAHPNALGGKGFHRLIVIQRQASRLNGFWLHRPPARACHGCGARFINVALAIGVEPTKEIAATSGSCEQSVHQRQVLVAVQRYSSRPQAGRLQGVALAKRIALRVVPFLLGLRMNVLPHA